MDEKNQQIKQKVLRRKRIAAVIFVIGLIIASLLIYMVWGRPLIQFISDPENARSIETENPTGSRIAFVLLMMIQVIIAIIPGEPLEIAAGYAFGAIEGTLLCSAGITMGAVLVFIVVKKYGRPIVELFFTADKIDSIRIFNNPRKLNAVAFIVFFIPGTPKDLLTYFVGLTPMKLRTWLFITTIARLPSIVTSTIVGDAINEQKYVTAIVVFAATALLALVGFVFWHKINQKKTD